MCSVCEIVEKYFIFFNDLTNTTHTIQKVYSSSIRGGTNIGKGSLQRLIKIFYQVFHRLQANGEANEIGRDAGLNLLLFRQLRMCGASGMNNQRLGIAHVSQVREQLDMA